MGIGDQLMASGEARAHHARTGRPVLIKRADGKHQWSDLWDGVPYVVHPRAFDPTRHDAIINGGGSRPYIEQKTASWWRWRAYEPQAATIAFTEAELQFAASVVRTPGCVMIEPNVKNIGHRNKDWGLDRWQELVKALPGVSFVQCLEPGPNTRMLSGVQAITTPSFRHAAAVLQACAGFVGSEGGLMHAAAAVDRPAVIVRGEFISPAATGYPAHRNLFTGKGLGCGRRYDCPGCREAMRRITVPTVARHVEELLCPI